MSAVLDGFSQPAGALGIFENGLVRYGLSAILWGSLFIVAWFRQRDYDVARERLLAPAFGFGFVTSLLMLLLVTMQMLQVLPSGSAYPFLAPLQRALGLAATVVIAGAYLRYVLDEVRSPRAYLLAGLAVTLLCLVLALWQASGAVTQVRFRGTWPAWLFDLATISLVLSAIVLLRKERTWLSRGVTVALLLVLAGEIVLLANNSTTRDYRAVAGTIGHGLNMLAILTFAHVYARQQAMDRRRTEKDLAAYRGRLEELVAERTAELMWVNARLQQEVRDRTQAEEVLRQLSSRYELILETAGAGICGIDRSGRFTFVNRSAAGMLGYEVDELIGQPSHPILHHSRADHTAYPAEQCPIQAGYTLGIASQGEDEYYWRKDNSAFPIQYVSSPTYEEGTHTGTVLVFRDITDRKRAEAEIARRTADLAAQNTIAAALSRSFDLDSTLAAALDGLLPAVDMEAGLVFLGNGGAQALLLRSYRGQVALDDLQPGAVHGAAYQAISRAAMTNLQAVAHSEAAASGSQATSNGASQPLRTLVSAPLVSKGQVIGALTVGSQRTVPIPASVLALMTAVGQQIGMAVESSRLYRAVESSAEMLSRLHQASIILTSTLDSAKIYQQIAEQSVWLLDCQAAGILMWDENEQRAELIASYGLDEAEGETLWAGPGVSERLRDLVACHPSTAVSDALADARVPQAWRESLDIRALLCVPIVGMERSLGTLFVIDRRARRNWRPNDQALIESFVNVAAIALTNADYHIQLQWAAALEERQRIAADMHDGLAQTVALLGLRIDEVMELTAQGADREALERLSQVRTTVDQVSVDVRRSIASLTAIPQPVRSLQELLSELLEKFPASDGAAIDYHCQTQEPLFLTQAQQAEALLVMQEALLNARRHAHAERIDLRLGCNSQDVSITVEDNGVGFDPGAWWTDKHNRFGLNIMHARAARIGARLQIDSAPGQGTRVVLKLPLACADAGPQPAATPAAAARQAGPRPGVET